MEEQVESLTQTVLKELMATDTPLASHCDLAVMRCLFSPEWSEPGAVWALRYMERRLVLLRHEHRRERVESSTQLRFQRLRATLPETFFSSPDAVTGQAIDFGVLRSLSMPQLTPHHHYSTTTVVTSALPSCRDHITNSTETATNSEEQEQNSAAGKT